MLNARVVSDTGLNMPVISWYLFGGHANAISSLLSFGNKSGKNYKGGNQVVRDVNLLDVNLLFFDEQGEVLSGYDVVDNILTRNGWKGGDYEESEALASSASRASFLYIYDLLVKNGALSSENVTKRKDWTAKVRKIEMLATTTNDSDGPASYHPLKDKNSVVKHQPVFIVAGVLQGIVYIAGDKSDFEDNVPPLTLHPMDYDHHIQYVYLLDEDDNVIYYNDFDLEDDHNAYTDVFTIPNNVKLTPYQYCNKRNFHGRVHDPQFGQHDHHGCGRHACHSSKESSAHEQTITKYTTNHISTLTVSQPQSAATRVARR